VLSPGAKNIEFLGVFAGGREAYPKGEKLPVNIPNPYFERVVERRTQKLVIIKKVLYNKALILGSMNIY
jgi:hypothetical protein